jgi:hypothetical protein
LNRGRMKCTGKQYILLFSSLIYFTLDHVIVVLFGFLAAQVTFHSVLLNV